MDSSGGGESGARIWYSVSMKRNFRTSLFISLGAVFAAASIGSLATFGPVKTWYPGLAKPPFNPPSWIFGPVWTLLYLMMALALALVLVSRKKKNKNGAVALFAAQLVFNSLWSVVFFGLRLLWPAFAVIVVLWFLILITALLFFRINRAASYLLLPYLAWVSFASVLNFSVATLN